MKLYVISGLGADFTVLEKLKFPIGYDVEFLDWLIPEQDETFEHYVQRMANRIDDSESFCLLGYSFGGIIVQEIHRIKPAEKVIILGSIKSDKEKSKFIKFGQISRLPRLIPLKLFNDRSSAFYSAVRHFFDPKNPKVLDYFKMKDPYYLKWSIEKISDWKFEGMPNVIQIMGDKDIVFPIKNSKPDYIIKGGTHLFPATKPREVSKLLKDILET